MTGSMNTQDLRVKAERLHTSIETMARIGATENGGVTRLALSEEDRQARDLLWQWMIEAGMTVKVDDFGNMTGRREGTEELPPIMSGSHLDSVRRGGKWDGALGVLGPLEVVRLLNEHDIQTSHPIEIVNFTSEEGSRFEPAMIASGAVAGVFSPEFVHSRKGPDGISFGDALKAIGYAGEPENRPVNGAAFIELHNEQNPILDDANLPVGVVEGIRGITWWEVTVTGEANNGPTPMSHRRDALAAAAEIVTGVRQIALETGDGATGLVGRIRNEPDLVNVVPARVVFSVDFRHQDLYVIEQMIDRMRGLISEVEQSHGVEINAERLWLSEPTPFDSGIVDTVDQACQSAGIPSMRLWSGPGHDAKYMASVCPTGMIFVRSDRGKSHAEDEYSAPADVEASVNALLHSLLSLARPV
jgi:beta-ureidopropionase / N-carbamoyl-L-amino-acid hydrolase